MKQWAANLVFCVMSLVLIGYITPDGKYEKQIRLSMSVLFVAAIFIPAIDFLRGGSYNEAFFENMLTIDRQAVAYQTKDLNAAYDSEILKAYKTDLEESMKNRLERKAGFEGSVTVRINDDAQSEGYGEILSVEIAPASGSEESGEPLRKIINEFYLVDNENINITESEANG